MTTTITPAQIGLPAEPRPGDLADAAIRATVRALGRVSIRARLERVFEGLVAGGCP